MTMKNQSIALFLLLALAACGKSDPTTPYPVVTTGTNTDYSPYPQQTYPTGAYPQGAAYPQQVVPTQGVPYGNPGLAYARQGAAAAPGAFALGPGAAVLPGAALPPGAPQRFQIPGNPGAMPPGQHPGSPAQGQGCRQGHRVVEMTPDPGPGLPIPPGAACADRNPPISMIFECVDPQTGQTYDAPGLGCRQ